MPPPQAPDDRVQAPRPKPGESARPLSRPRPGGPHAPSLTSAARISAGSGQSRPSRTSSPRKRKRVRVPAGLWGGGAGGGGGEGEGKGEGRREGEGEGEGRREARSLLPPHPPRAPAGPPRAPALCRSRRRGPCPSPARAHPCAGAVPRSGCGGHAEPVRRGVGGTRSAPAAGRPEPRAAAALGRAGTLGAGPGQALPSAPVRPPGTFGKRPPGGEEGT